MKRRNLFPNHTRVHTLSLLHISQSHKLSCQSHSLKPKSKLFTSDLLNSIKEKFYITISIFQTESALTDSFITRGDVQVDFS